MIALFQLVYPRIPHVNLPAQSMNFVKPASRRGARLQRERGCNIGALLDNARGARSGVEKARDGGCSVERVVVDGHFFRDADKGGRSERWWDGWLLARNAAAQAIFRGLPALLGAVLVEGVNVEADGLVDRLHGGGRGRRGMGRFGTRSRESLPPNRRDA